MPSPRQRVSKYFGSATDNLEFSDAAYVKILSDTTEFGQITVGKTQKWEYIKPARIASATLKVML
jgi:endo-1,4-beta-xylanase